MVQRSKVFMTGKRIIAVVLGGLLCVLLGSETYALIAYLIPYAAITLYKTAGITMSEGLTIASFSVGDAVALCMLWLLPSLCMTALITICQWKLICVVMKRIRRMLVSAFRKQTAVSAVAFDAKTDTGTDGGAEKAVPDAEE